MMQAFLELLRSYDPSYDDDRFEAFCTQMEQEWHALRGGCTEEEAASMIDGLPGDGIHKDVVGELRRIERDYLRGKRTAPAPPPIPAAPAPVAPIVTDPLPPTVVTDMPELPGYADDALRELLETEAKLRVELDGKRELIEQYRADILQLDAESADKKCLLDERNRDTYEMRQGLEARRREHQRLRAQLMPEAYMALLWPMSGQKSVFEQLFDTLCERTGVSATQTASLGLFPHMPLRDETFTVGDRRMLAVPPISGAQYVDQAGLEMIRWCAGLLDPMRAADGSLPKQISFTAIGLTVPLYGLLWSVYAAITFYDRWTERGTSQCPAEMEHDPILMKAFQFAALRFSAVLLTEQGEMRAERDRVEMARQYGLIGMHKLICQWFDDKDDPYAMFGIAKDLWPVLDGSPCILRDTR